MKPLLIFGLRGTLLERIHASRVPPGMPGGALTVGMSRVWLRPGVVGALAALQPHCHLAIWSATTARNTAPVMEAVFGKYTHPTQSSSSEGGWDHHNNNSNNNNSNSASQQQQQLLKFEFVWSREHTGSDEFRRSNANTRDDQHATVKDLREVYRRFPNIATPQNTILIDDTPSKGKLNAANFIWLETCEELKIENAAVMPALQRFVEEKVLAEKEDVRRVLPVRIPWGS